MQNPFQNKYLNILAPALSVTFSTGEPFSAVKHSQEEGMAQKRDDNRVVVAVDANEAPQN